MIRIRLPLLLVCALAAAVHLNSLGNGFVQDDRAIVVDNDRIHDLGRLPEAVASPYWPRTPGRIALYRPFTTASFAVDWSIWQGRPFGFHLTNVVLHTAVVGVLFLLLAQLGAGTVGAAAGAALFAVHPVHVEAVANVVGRAEILAALFFLLGCLAYLRSSSHGWGSAAVVAILYFLSVASKEIGATLPAVLLLLHLREGGPAGASARAALAAARDSWRVYVLAALALAAYFAARRFSTGVVIGGDVAPWFWGEPTSVRIWTAVRLWPEYVRLMLFPLSLSPDYSPGVILPQRSWAAPGVLLGLLTGLGAVTLAGFLRSRIPLAVVGLAWFILTVLPVSGLLVENSFLLAERTLYLPSVGLSVAVAGAFAALRVHRFGWMRPAIAGFLVLLLTGGVRSWIQNPVWRDDDTLSTYLVTHRPESYRAHVAHFDRLKAIGREEEALSHLATAVELVPGHFALRMEYGRELYVRGLYDAAAEHFEVARRVVPELELPHLMVLASLIEAGREQEAAEVGIDVLERFPGSPEALRLLEGGEVGAPAPGAVRPVPPGLMDPGGSPP